MGEFEQKKAVVTGATRGIGRAVCEALLADGCRVIGLYGGNHAAAERFQAQWDEGQLKLICCNVADYEQVKETFVTVESHFDTLDILVNNAGIRRDAIVALMSSEQWQAVLDVNLTGTFNTTKFAVPLMLKQKYGRIVTITSPSSYMGIQGQGNYAASKAGQIGFTRTLAKEVARKKITANCVSPGFIKTELIDDLSDKQISAYKKLVPMRRFGTIDEVVDGVLFLASEKASYITGTTLEISGGL